MVRGFGFGFGFQNQGGTCDLPFQITRQVTFIYLWFKITYHKTKLDFYMTH